MFIYKTLIQMILTFISIIWGNVHFLEVSQKILEPLWRISRRGGIQQMLYGALAANTDSLAVCIK